MRSYLAGCAGLLGCLAPLVAGEPQMSRIVRPEVEVRGGPSDKYPITSRLHRDDPVYVIGPAANPGWLEIKPPPGSICWIPDRMVQQMPKDPKSLNVLGDGEVPLRIGGVTSSLPLDVYSKVKLKRGALLTVLGEKAIHEKTTWWPVIPPAGDARYILADSIAAPAAGTSASAKTTGTAEPGFAPPPATTDGNSKPKEILSAERAEKEGRYEDAYRIYATFAQQHNAPNGDFAQVRYCTTRMRELIDGGYVKATLSGNPKSGISSLGSPAVRSGSSPVGTANPTAPPPPLPPLGSPQTGNPGPPIQPVKTASQGSRGYLRRAGFTIDGQTTYALEDSRGSLLLYATAGSGVDLEPLIGKAVELQGPAMQRGDVRGGVHMTVTKVYLLR